MLKIELTPAEIRFVQAMIAFARTCMNADNTRRANAIADKLLQAALSERVAA